MTDVELDNLATAIAAKLRPAISLDIDLWSAEEIGLFFKRDPKHVRERLVYLPRFPAAIKIPVLGSKVKSRPLWRACEVVDWANLHQEKKRF